MKGIFAYLGEDYFKNNLYIDVLYTPKRISIALICSVNDGTEIPNQI